MNGDIRGIKIGVVRHWEKEYGVDQEVCVAMNQAIETLGHLGASITDVEMGSLQDYSDVKIAIAECEIFSIHHKLLIERIEEYGEEFLGQTLGGCLFGGIDYVNAQRKRRQMVIDMKPLYEKHDILLSACAGPAPRLDQYRIMGFWEKPNITTPFSVTGGPALALCNGISSSHLPLSMQIASRPFNEEIVFRVGYAYEQATPWHTKKPNLLKSTRQPEVIRSPEVLDASKADSDICDFALSCARRAGLTLGEKHFSRLCQVAPYALAMASRLPRNHPMYLEPANSFYFK
jgi:aspartyl-tRNA(Asn)/glutamyl-tRNA(Gln) amidotransferase subunit A